MSAKAELLTEVRELAETHSWKKILAAMESCREADYRQQPELLLHKVSAELGCALEGDAERDFRLLLTLLEVPYWAGFMLPQFARFGERSRAALDTAMEGWLVTGAVPPRLASESIQAAAPEVWPVALLLRAAEYRARYGLPNEYRAEPEPDQRASVPALLEVVRAKGGGARAAEMEARVAQARADAAAEGERAAVEGRSEPPDLAQVEEDFMFPIPRALRRAWSAHRRPDHARRRFLLRGDATPDAMTAIADGFRVIHFKDDDSFPVAGRPYPVLPFARGETEGSYLCLYLLLARPDGDFAILDVSDAAVRVVAQSSREWLAQRAE